MKIKFSRSQLFSYLTSVLISVFLVAAFVFGATTISNNIDTAGTLTVAGASSLANATTSTSMYVSGVFQANGASSTITNVVLVNASSTNATSTALYVSGSLGVNGASSTITNVVLVNASSTNATTTTLYVSGAFQANGASSTITNLVVVNSVDTSATSTSATTTSFHISGSLTASVASSTITTLNVANFAGTLGTTTSATSTSFYISGGFGANGASSTVVNLMSTGASTTRFALLSANGATAIFSMTPDSATTTSLIRRLGGAATTTLVNAQINAFSIATSTDITPIISIDTTAGGRVGIGTTAPSQTFSITSFNGTTTLYLASPSNRTCIQMESATGTPYRLYIDESLAGVSPNIGPLRAEPGSCL